MCGVPPCFSNSKSVTQNFCGPTICISARLKIWQVPACNVSLLQLVSPSVALLAKLFTLFFWFANIQFSGKIEFYVTFIWLDNMWNCIYFSKWKIGSRTKVNFFHVCHLPKKGSLCQLLLMVLAVFPPLLTSTLCRTVKLTTLHSLDGTDQGLALFSDVPTISLTLFRFLTLVHFPLLCLVTLGPI